MSNICPISEWLLDHHRHHHHRHHHHHHLSLKREGRWGTTDIRYEQKKVREVGLLMNVWINERMGEDGLPFFAGVGRRGRGWGVEERACQKIRTAIRCEQKTVREVTCLGLC